MTAVYPYSDDPGPAEAERIAREWTQHHEPVTEEQAAQWLEAPKGYVGRHLGVDEETISLLVEANICWYLGDRRGWEDNQVEARQRLYGQGHDRASALEAIRRVDDIVFDRANATVVGWQAAAEHLSDVDTVADLLGDAQ